MPWVQVLPDKSWLQSLPEHPQEKRLSLHQPVPLQTSFKSLRSHEIVSSPKWAKTSPTLISIHPSRKPFPVQHLQSFPPATGGIPYEVMQNVATGKIREWTGQRTVRPIFSQWWLIHKNWALNDLIRTSNISSGQYWEKWNMLQLPGIAIALSIVSNISWSAKETSFLEQGKGTAGSGCLCLCNLRTPQWKPQAEEQLLGSFPFSLVF